MKLQSDRKIRKRKIGSQVNPYSQENQENLSQSYQGRSQSSSRSISNIPKNKLKLMPIKQSLIKDKNEETSKNSVNKRRAKSYLNTDISELKEQISKIRHQIMAKKSKIHVPNYIEDIDNQIMFSPIVEHKKQLFKPFWNESNNKKSPKKYNRMGINSSKNKKHRELTMVSESESEEQQNTQSSHYFPIIQKSKLKETYFKNKGKGIYSSVSYNSSSQKQQKMAQIKRNGRVRQNLRNFRKAAHAVLFTIYLRKFNQRMRERRKSSFTKFINTELTPKLLQIKELIIQHSKPFFNNLSQQSQFDFRPAPKDDSKLRKQKLKYLKKLVSQQIHCLKEAVGTILAQKQKYRSLFYLLCKHGSYSNLHSIYTSQEINLMCVSQFYSYLRADKYLEQSALVSLLMIKLFLFNVLFDQNLILDLYGSKNMGFMGQTTQLIGNIFYQLFIDIQDEFLEKVPPIYKVGNWQTLKDKINLKLAQNMTVKEGFFQKNELISGLEDHKTIIEMFETKGMLSQKQEIKQIIKKLYVLICNHHKKVREKSIVG